MIRKILYLEDCEEDFELFRQALRSSKALAEREMFFVDHAITPQDARSLMAFEHYDVIVVDIRLAGESGLDFVHELWDSHHQGPMVLTSGASSVEIDEGTLELMTRGRLQFVSKYELATPRLAEVLNRALRCEWKLLVVNGEQDTASFLEQLLVREGEHRFQVDAAMTPDAAAAMLDVARYDACLLDGSLGSEATEAFMGMLDGLEPGMRPAVIFTGDALLGPGLMLVGNHRNQDVGFLRLDEISPDSLAVVISRTCGESQWRVVREALHS